MTVLLLLLLILLVYVNLAVLIVVAVVIIHCYCYHYYQQEVVVYDEQHSKSLVSAGTGPAPLAPTVGIGNECAHGLHKSGLFAPMVKAQV